jgi:hypothetical protein
MLKSLKREYSKYDSVNKSWLNGLFMAAIVLLIFLLFQPFGFQDKDIDLKIVLLPTYALLAFLYALISFLIARHILKRKKVWNLGNEIVFYIMGALVLTLIVHLFTYWVAGDMPLTLGWYFRLLYHVASLMLLIRFLEYFYYSYRAAYYDNRELNSQVELTQQKLEEINKQSSQIINISTEKEQININRNKVIYIESSGNYLEIYLREPDEGLSKITKRGRLHQIEQNLSPYPEFFRCHRAFIINLDYITHLEGNVKNARISLKGFSKKIPVSRSHYTSLKNKIEAIALG